MQDEFSLEHFKSKINSPKTAEYFEEVYSSYAHGNYRSSVVMLWTVVVLDIFQKLQALKDSYDDSIATTILESIDAENKKDKKSSSWELGIIEEVCKKTDLIEDSEFKNLKYLQQQRHLSAHPIICNGVELYVPNKDTTRALIRNALEIVLIKPPVYTDKIFDKILNDLARNGSNFSDMSELRPYIEYKYLNRITTKTKLKLFETFWKFVMRLDNAECDKNRLDNLRFLIILAWNKPAEIHQQIKDKPALYNRIEDGEKFIHALIIFLARVPSVYKLLSEETKIVIGINIESSIEYIMTSTYTKDTLAEHYDYLEDKLKEHRGSTAISPRLWEILYDRSDSKEMEQRCLKAISLNYSVSPSFNRADQAMASIMRFLNRYTVETLQYLLAESEKNNQTYARAQASTDYKIIKDHIKTLKEDFDFTKYPNFNQEADKEETATEIA